MKNELNKVGNIKISRLGKSSITAEYSDGDFENQLLEMFKNGMTDAKRREIIAKDPAWPIRYHVAYERQNLLNWYEFKKDSSILEVGSGCGAITEVLVKSKAKKVVANELSERRASVNAHRNAKATNLEVLIGNLQEYKPTEKFDYVICVGVLEYAGTFIDSDQPYSEFLKLLRSFLKDGGRLLLAIENKMGLKYFAGAKEDHTGVLFDGMNGYPGMQKIKTFGKKELSELLVNNSFGINRFYYPFPDYKLPKTVYSDDFYPGKHTSMPLGLVTGIAHDQKRYNLFNEQALMLSLEKNDMFREMANSFLVEVIAK